MSEKGSYTTDFHLTRSHNTGLLKSSAGRDVNKCVYSSTVASVEYCLMNKQLVVTHGTLLDVKRHLCQRLRGLAGQKVVERLRQCVDRALSAGTCISLVAIASRDAMQSQCRAVNMLLADYGSSIRVARIRGSIFGEDHKALLNATGQLLTLSGTSDFSMNMEALEKQLSTGYSTRNPTVIVVEDIHEFCRRDKQVLLYSLLDMLHKQKLLYVFIGLTHDNRINEMLEKRVSSRLNAEYLFTLISGSVEDMRADLIKAIHLDTVDTVSPRGTKRRRTLLDRVGSEASQFDSFAVEFNRSSEALLCGEEMRRLMMDRLAWGHDVEYMRHILETAVTHLSVATPLLSLRAVKDAMSDTDPNHLFFSVASLPRIDLLLLIAITRLAAVESTGNAFPLTRVLKDFGALYNGKLDCSEMTGRLGRGVLALQELGLVRIGPAMATSISATVSRASLPGSTVLGLVPAPLQVQQLFRVTGGDLNVIKVSVRVREALLNPLQPIQIMLSADM